jgi:cell division septation protein DedD
MTPIQQQRLLGLGLLLLLIGFVAYFLISNANQNHQEVVDDEINPVDNFASLVEPLDENVFDDFSEQEEALVDPHKLSTTVPKQETSLNDAILNNVTSAKTLEETEAQNEIVEIEQAVKSKLLTDETSELWTAQLAGFSSKANAQALAEKVKRLGYDVELLTVKTGNKTIYRVRLQSEKNKLSIEKKSDSLKKALGLNPQVFRVSN